MTRLGVQRSRKNESAAHVNDEVAVLRCSNIHLIEASQLNVQVSNVTQQLAFNRCTTAVW